MLDSGGSRENRWGSVFTETILIKKRKKERQFGKKHYLCTRKAFKKSAGQGFDPSRSKCRYMPLII